MGKCKHTDWVAAGYPYTYRNGQKDIRVQSMYHVFCRGCNHFINLLNNEIIDDTGLVRIDRQK